MLTRTQTRARKALPISFWDRQWAITCSISPGRRWSDLTWACWTTLAAEELHASAHRTGKQEKDCLFFRIRRKRISKVCSAKTFFFFFFWWWKASHGMRTIRTIRFIFSSPPSYESAAGNNIAGINKRTEKNGSVVKKLFEDSSEFKDTEWIVML